MAVWEAVKKVWQPGCSLEGWMYTVNDDTNLGLRTIGYCMSWEDRVARTQADIAHYGIPSLKDLLDRCRSYMHNFHEAPHLTKQEAIECYRDYLFDLHCQSYNYATPEHKCDLCGNLTSFAVYITATDTQRDPIFLCNPHSTREDMRAAFYKTFWIGDVTNLGPVRPKPQTCICDPRLLFNQGCQCGYLKGATDA